MHGSVDAYWREQEPLLQKVYALGMEAYISTLPMAAAFHPANRDLRCMDGRTPSGLHLAGSGMLLGEDAIAIARSAGATGIYSHSGCGAAALYLRNGNGTFADAETAARWWAQQLAAKLGVPYRGHLAVEPGFHPERIAYYDGTGRFDWSLVPGLPPGFTIDRCHNTKSPQDELSLAAQIAFGEHGFGQRFTAEQPFLIVPIGQSGLPLEALRAEAASVVGDLPWRDRIRIQGFTARPEWLGSY